jgi:hypothetical protein
MMSVEAQTTKPSRAVIPADGKHQRFGNEMETESGLSCHDTFGEKGAGWGASHAPHRMALVANIQTEAGVGVNALAARLQDSRQKHSSASFSQARRVARLVFLTCA